MAVDAGQGSSSAPTLELLVSTAPSRPGSRSTRTLRSSVGGAPGIKRAGTSAPCSCSTDPIRPPDKSPVCPDSRRMDRQPQQCRPPSRLGPGSRPQTCDTDPSSAPPAYKSTRQNATLCIQHPRNAHQLSPRLPPPQATRNLAPEVCSAPSHKQPCNSRSSSRRFRQGDACRTWRHVYRQAGQGRTSCTVVKPLL